MFGFLQFLREAMAPNMFRDLAKPPVMPLLFHKDIGIPKSLKSGPAAGLRLNYGSHAKSAAQDDRYGNYAHMLPPVVPAQYQIIEVEAQGKQVSKWVIRFPLAIGDKRDLVLVVQPDGFVRTVWVNEHDDKHGTLKRHLYAAPTQYRN